MKKCLIFLFILISFMVFLPAESKTISASDNVLAVSKIMPYKDISHRILVLRKMRKQTEQLSEEDKNVIKKYVFGAVKGEDTYLLINCYLRDNLQDYIPKKEITKPLKCRLDYYAKHLGTSVSKAKLPQNMILYRGIDEKGMKSIFKNKNIANVINKPVTEENLAVLRKNLIGVKYTEKGFLSTSYDKNCAKQTKFMFEVYAPKNLQAVLIEDFGKKNEKEVLINKNTKWEIVDIKISHKNDRYFYNIKIK